MSLDIINLKNLTETIFKEHICVQKKDASL